MSGERRGSWKFRSPINSFARNRMEWSGMRRDETRVLHSTNPFSFQTTTGLLIRNHAHSRLLSCGKITDWLFVYIINVPPPNTNLNSLLSSSRLGGSENKSNKRNSPLMRWECERNNKWMKVARKSLQRLDWSPINRLFPMQSCKSFLRLLQVTEGESFFDSVYFRVPP